MTHTQGPWHVHKDGDVYAPDGERVIGVGVRKDAQERAANAHLIAAAPETTKALRDLVEDLEARAVKGVVDCSDGVYCRARAALSKAEGRA